MLEARLLTKRYGGITVVDHVSFAIKPGEILGYVGPNGAGKSTLEGVFAQLTQPENTDAVARQILDVVAE